MVDVGKLLGSVGGWARCFFYGLVLRWPSLDVEWTLVIRWVSCRAVTRAAGSNRCGRRRVAGQLGGLDVVRVGAVASFGVKWTPMTRWAPAKPKGGGVGVGAGLPAALARGQHWE